MLQSFIKSSSLPLSAIAFSAALLLGCSSSDDSPSTDGGTDGGSTDGGEMQAGSPYVGTWASGCFMLDAGEYSDEIVEVTATTFSYTFNTFDTADCSGSAILAASGRVSGTYSEGADITTATGLTAREVDYTIVQTALADGSVVDGPLDGQTVMDLVYIDANDLLYFGDGGFNNKVIARPTTLTLDVPYTRQ